MAVEDFLLLYSELVERERGLLEESIAALEPEVVGRGLQKVAYRKPSSPLEVFEFEGCSEADVAELAAVWGGWMPDAVGAFLYLAGRSSFYVSLGFGLRYPDILRAADAVDDWLDELGPVKPDWYGNGERFRIPETACHLGHHGGGRFYFFVDRVADPEVFEMFEGVSEGSAVSSTGLRFSEYVLTGLLSPRRAVEGGLRAVIS